MSAPMGAGARPVGAGVAPTTQQNLNQIVSMPFQSVISVQQNFPYSADCQ